MDLRGHWSKIKVNSDKKKPGMPNNYQNTSVRQKSKINRLICCSHTYAKYLAKRVDGIPFLLILLAYSETIGCEKRK